MAHCTLETITVTGAGMAVVNGMYTLDEETDQYIKNDEGVYIFYSIGGEGSGNNGPGWYVFTIPPTGFGFRYYAAQDPADCPTGLTFVGINSQVGDSFVLEGGAPSQNTFGLPSDVVALITSRFGTVANFLRLRNQGQV
jgi:hypothetical protein